MTELEPNERRRLAQLAEEYRSKGYQVWVEPSAAELPEWLRLYRPDLVAQSADDSVVVEVRSRPSLSKDSSLSNLAAAIEKMPGWRFDLVVVSPRRRAATPLGASLRADEIRDRLSQVDRLLQQRLLDAAFVLAWATAEASMREVAAQSNIALPELAPSKVIKTLYSQGVLSKEAYDNLVAAMQIRNAIVHGFAPPEDPVQHIRNLLDVIDEIQQHRPTDA